ncbi:hypothetical protein, partial [Parafrankia sp. EUN1f]
MPPRGRASALRVFRESQVRRDRRGRFARQNGVGGAANAAGRHRAGRPATAGPTRAQADAAEARLRGYFGDRLHVEDRDHPAIRQHLVDLDRLPPQHLRRLAAWFAEYDGGGIYMADRPHVLDVLDRDEMRRKFADGRTDDAAGMYFNVERVISMTANRARSG